MVRGGLIYTGVATAILIIPFSMIEEYLMGSMIVLGFISDAS